MSIFLFIVLVIVLAALGSSQNNLKQKTTEHEESSLQLKAESEESKRLKRELERLQVIEEDHRRIPCVETEISRMRRNAETRQESIEQEIREAKNRLWEVNKRANEIEKQNADVQNRLDSLSEGYDHTLVEASIKDYLEVDSPTIQERLQQVRAQQTQLRKSGEGARCKKPGLLKKQFNIDAKLQKKLIKLITLAFEKECSAIIRSVRHSNFEKSQDKISACRKAINELVQPFYCAIPKKYENSKLRELELHYNLAKKKQDEKEEQRLIKERMREEREALKEIKEAEEKAAAEEREIATRLAQKEKEIALAEEQRKNKELSEEALKQFEVEKARLLADIEDLKRQEEAARESKERALSMAQQTKAGVVYIVSNIGSFGDQVFKVGLTRRLEPLERIKELGGASVPFPFDVHGMIRADDAPALEARIHSLLDAHRVNKVNRRKEFFRTRATDLQKILTDEGIEVELTLLAEASEYRASTAHPEDAVNGNNYTQDSQENSARAS